MPTNTDARIESLAESCVDDMGDIFWDHEADRDSSGEFSDPYQVAIRAVRQVLKAFAEESYFDTGSAKSIGEGGEPIVVGEGMKATDNAGTTSHATVVESSEHRAAVVLQLARQYGASLLRDALNVAEELRIEDGLFQ